MWFVAYCCGIVPEREFAVDNRPGVYPQPDSCLQLSVCSLVHLFVDLPTFPCIIIPICK